MDYNVDVIVADILKNTLGHPKSDRALFESNTKPQLEFNCPTLSCNHDINKFNLAYNIKTKVFKCWKCKYSGFVLKIIHDYGNKKDYDNVKLLLPYKDNGNFNVFRKPEIDPNLITCDLPEGYHPLNDRLNTNIYKISYEYVIQERKLTEEDIDFFKIGYTEIGKRKNRIIIPSFNTNGIINYFEARTIFKNNKMTYYKPDSPDKSDIIFNEMHVNWDLPVYLVEGIFDSMRIPNSIPLLGKDLKDTLLFEKILLYKPVIILCFDVDAIKDTIEIYNYLMYFGIKVFFIDMKGYTDVSKIVEDFGKEALCNLLKTKKKLDFNLEIYKKLSE